MSAIKSFWSHPVKTMSLHEVVTSHRNDRSLDNKLKWLGYKSIPSNGVVSNVFRILVNPKQTFFRYDIRPTYDSAPRNTSAVKSASGRSDRPDSRFLSLQRLVTRSFTQGKLTLPHFFVQDKLYSMGEVPRALLNIPNGMLDIHMKKCALTLVQRNVPLLEFPLPELQRFSNQMIKWCIRLHGDRNGNYFLAKESNGKVVQSETGISVNGMRIFRGVQSQMVYVTNSNHGDIELLTVLPPAPASRTLETMSLTDPAQSLTIELQVIQKLPVAKTGMCTSYMVRDSSGSVQLTVFDRDADNAPQFTVGSSYSFSDLRIKAESPAYKKGDFDFCLIWSARSKAAETSEKLSAKESSGKSLQPLKPETRKEHAKIELGLRIDSLCTVASEKNLLEDVLAEFGPPPYSNEAVVKILSLFYKLAVVDALTLKQNHILNVLFPSQDTTNLHEFLTEASRNTAKYMPERYTKHFPELHHAAQPVAVLTDDTMVPIQFLHRGYDMLNNWQNTTVPACSILPARRLAILQQYVRAVSEGLSVWGMTVLQNPMITRDAQVMHVPEKKQLPSSTEDPRLSPPRETVVIHIRGKGKYAEKDEKSSMSCARDMEAVNSMSTDSMDGAVAYVKTLERKKVCAAIILIQEDSKRKQTSDRFIAAAAQRGYIPVLFKPCKHKAKYNLWKSQLKRYLYFKANGNPLCNVNIRGVTPTVQNRVILFVGIDTCHTFEASTGALVGVLFQGPLKIPVMFPFFWSRDGAREAASETAGVAAAFTTVVQEVIALLKRFQAALTEVIVMQDGSIFSEMHHLETHVPEGVHFTYMNLHKRTNMRFINSTGGADVNCPKGSLVQDLTPLHASERNCSPSFFIQSHDCMMSTARPVQVVCRKVAPHWTLEALQKLCFALSHVHTLLPSKLPFPVKCAHILADKAHGAYLCDRGFSNGSVPITIRHRMWFL